VAEIATALAQTNEAAAALGVVLIVLAAILTFSLWTGNSRVHSLAKNEVLRRAWLFVIGTNLVDTTESRARAAFHPIIGSAFNVSNRPLIDGATSLSQNSFGVEGDLVVSSNLASIQSLAALHR
jgi:hypothetical protein